jgi:hypothetical protein
VVLQAALLENESSAQPSLVSCFLCSHGDIASVPRASLSGTHATASPVPGPSPGTSVGCRPRRLLPTNRSRVADSRQSCPSGRPQEEEKKPGPPARAEERKPKGTCDQEIGSESESETEPGGRDEGERVWGVVVVVVVADQPPVSLENVRGAEEDRACRTCWRPSPPASRRGRERGGSTPPPLWRSACAGLWRAAEGRERWRWRLEEQEIKEGWELIGIW